VILRESPARRVAGPPAVGAKHGGVRREACLCVLGAGSLAKHWEGQAWAANGWVSVCVGSKVIRAGSPGDGMPSSFASGQAGECRGAAGKRHTEEESKRGKHQAQKGWERWRAAPSARAMAAQCFYRVVERAGRRGPRPSGKSGQRTGTRTAANCGSLGVIRDVYLG